MVSSDRCLCREQGCQKVFSIRLLDALGNQLIGLGQGRSIVREKIVRDWGRLKSLGRVPRKPNPIASRATGHSTDEIEDADAKTVALGRGQHSHQLDEMGHRRVTRRVHRLLMTKVTVVVEFLPMLASLIQFTSQTCKPLGHRGTVAVGGTEK